jgi:dynein heavy chain
LEGELNLAPSFPVPSNSDYKGYHAYIDDVLPPESPYLYGLHPNAEIGFLTATSDNLFKTVLEMQPRDAGGGEGGGGTREEKVGYLGVFGEGLYSMVMINMSSVYTIHIIFCVIKKLKSNQSLLSD